MSMESEDMQLLTAENSEETKMSKESEDYSDIVSTPRFQKLLNFVSSPHIEKLGGYAAVLPSVNCAILKRESRGLNKVMTDYGDIAKANQWLALYLYRCGEVQPLTAEMSEGETKTSNESKEDQLDTSGSLNIEKEEKINCNEKKLTSGASCCVLM